MRIKLYLFVLVTVCFSFTIDDETILGKEENFQLRRIYNSSNENVCIDWRFGYEPGTVKLEFTFDHGRDKIIIYHPRGGVGCYSVCSLTLH